MPSASPLYQEFTTMEVVNFPVVDASFIDNYPADKHVMVNELYAEDTMTTCTQAIGSQTTTCCTLTTTTTNSPCSTIPTVSADNTSYYQMGSLRYSLEPQTQCIEPLPMYGVSTHGSCDIYNSATLNHDDSSGKSMCYSTHYGSSTPRNNLCINESKSCQSFNRSSDCQYERYPHVNKCRIPDPEEVNILSWTTKHPINWSEAEVLDWLYSCVQDHKIDGETFRGEAFSDINGSKICQMTLEDFVKLESTYGAILYNLLRKLYDDASFEKPYEFPDFSECDFTESFTENDESYFDQTTVSPHSLHRNQYTNSDGFTSTQIKQETVTSIPCDIIDGQRYEFDPFDTPPVHVYAGNPQSNMECILPTFSNSVISTAASCQYPVNRYHQSSPRRRPGRPRLKTLSCDGDPRSSKDKKAKNQHLWEFIYDALMNPVYNPQYLRWENQREGIFRFVQSEAVAQLWGSLKNNENMTYEKLSRAMRHYYKRGILERVEGRRLVYKFSLNAMERVREKKVLSVSVS